MAETDQVGIRVVEAAREAEGDAEGRVGVLQNVTEAVVDELLDRAAQAGRHHAQGADLVEVKSIGATVAGHEVGETGAGVQELHLHPAGHDLSQPDAVQPFVALDRAAVDPLLGPAALSVVGVFDGPAVRSIAVAGGALGEVGAGDAHLGLG